MTATLVRFDGVSKSYDGRTRVVAELDLEIRRGEFLTLLGPSGSGKTTTLMMLAGFEDPTAGSITLEGARIDTVPPHRRNIGVVFQNYALFPHLSVAENLAFPLSIRRVPRAEIGRRVAAALSMVRLPGLGGRRPQQLSGGQQQRVALARALIFNPPLVLLDEPLGALDKQLREELQAEIRRIHAELGVTMVYVTHDQSEALTLSDRIAVFDQGRIQQLGTAQAVYETPANPFVAGFIGENNRLPATVLDATRLRLAEGSMLATLPHGLQAGAAALVSIRPERVLLEAAEAAPNAAAARVEEVVYLGDHCRLRMAWAGRTDFFAKLPRQQAGQVPQAGTTLRIAIPEAAIIVFPA
ncbi:ABC transporter ATP-binding protein [Falsiroseomonas selenitidurans]|uniref:ABC transporter ATP-binding protein n=1 Tax=Falsiroseomonas selenitidurans TaxID=2716335 RepID=A0ABX1E3Y5_9PROT|nr:ABC transporter ATP-binding protein [Falsiroseomonas selenitidurans]NKC29635.1 ABC transporter ATP-binding protein [Falsiroseomonas selenitidurans]